MTGDVTVNSVTSTETMTWVPLKAFLFLPTMLADDSYGYRWMDQDSVVVRVITRPGTDDICLGGNLSTTVTLLGAVGTLSLVGTLILTSILF